MAFVKTPEEIEKMRQGGKLLSKALGAAIAAIRPGVRMFELDAIAEQVIREGGGEPSFKGYKTHRDEPPFPSTLCISRNEEMVHGLGNRSIVLKEGDIVGLDIGCWYQGLCTDMAVSVPVGVISPAAEKLMRVTRESLFAGVAAAKVGNHVIDISRAVQDVIQPHGYGIVRALVGHGVGHKVHEDPSVPNYVDKRVPNPELQEGMCLALEPMISMGDWDVETADDDWTVVLVDGSLGAHFEVTIVLTKDGPEVITPLPV